MRAIIIFSSVVKFKCDLNQLDKTDTDYYLMTSDNLFQTLKPHNKKFFKQIVSFASVKLETVLPEVEKIAEKYGKENIKFITDDESCLRLMPRLRERLGLPGTSFEKINQFIDKVKMKDVLAEAKIRVPHYLAFDKKRYREVAGVYLNAIISDIGFPMIAKPVDLYGAASIKKIHSAGELREWADHIQSDEQVYEVEEFIDGVLYHCNFLIQDQKVIFSTVEEYTWPCHTFADGFPSGSILLPDNHEKFKKLEDFHRKVVDVIQPPDGATHCEVFEKPDGELVFLEIAARSCGGIVVPLLEVASGVNLAVAHYQARMGLPMKLNSRPIEEYYSWAFIPKIAGKISQLLPPKVDSRMEIDWNVKVGDNIPGTVNADGDIVFRDSEQAGIIKCYNSNFDVLYRDFETIKYAEFFKMDE